MLFHHPTTPSAASVTLPVVGGLLLSLATTLCFAEQPVAGVVFTGPDFMGAWQDLYAGCQNLQDGVSTKVSSFMLVMDYGYKYDAICSFYDTLDCQRDPPPHHHLVETTNRVGELWTSYGEEKLSLDESMGDKVLSVECSWELWN